MSTVGSLTLCRALLEYVPTVLDGPPAGGSQNGGD
jgi:hypothetical protein